MDRFISGHDITSVWIRAIELLINRPDAEAFNLAVRIQKPTEESIPGRKIIDNFLENNVKGCQLGQIEMVAQTVFPYGFLYSCKNPNNPENRQDFYNEYMKNSKVIRANNPRGTYFQRLINWPYWDSKETKVNQLENIIKKINNEKSSRVVYESTFCSPANSENSYDTTLYNPENDKNFVMRMNFPCLSHISIKPEMPNYQAGKIHMTAMYRSHYFGCRAYGNYLGLGKLLKFIADSTNREVGELFCVSSLAKIETSKSEFIPLLQKLSLEKQ